MAQFILPIKADLKAQIPVLNMGGGIHQNSNRRLQYLVIKPPRAQSNSNHGKQEGQQHHTNLRNTVGRSRFRGKHGVAGFNALDHVARLSLTLVVFLAVRYQLAEWLWRAIKDIPHLCLCDRTIRGGCLLRQPDLIGIWENMLLKAITAENRKDAAKEHNQHRHRHSVHKRAFQ